ncbi:hypothetical protein ACMD2_22380 [Ananas comosus]|uniref:Uncharacterized protein n=1 Tax=Ananas comosus TaxID=4615 RepID=A0A199UZY7_ANACO|nr:hypothetical protein ACMD2_22380 [Ananas comosus]
MEAAAAAAEPARSSPSTAAAAPRPPQQRRRRRGGAAEEQVRVRRRTLEAVLEQCQRTLEMLKNADLEPDPDAGEEIGSKGSAGEEEEEEEEEEEVRSRTPSSVDYETDELCELLKCRVESRNFLEKVGSIHMSMSQDCHGIYGEANGNSSWDMITAKDLWGAKDVGGESESESDDYVLVCEEDIVDGLACFMAAYLLSLKQTKELTPDQLQEALRKTFSAKKKSRLQKAWDSSKVIYNLASWSATAIGMYQNPAIFRAASVALWSSCRAISKLL